jgi:hypothetical protein
VGRARLSIWFAIALVGTGCPFAIPGLRGDTSIAASVVDGKFKPAGHVLVGASLASMTTPPKFPFDVSAGYVLFYPSAKDAVHGGFVDAAYLRHFPSFMLSVGPRFEVLTQERRKGLHGGVGGSVRVAFETLTHTASEFGGGSGNTGGVGFVIGQSYGAVGIGLAAEFGVRRLPGQLFSAYGTLGLTFRLPAAAGFFFFIPFPK